MNNRIGIRNRIRKTNARISVLLDILKAERIRVQNNSTTFLVDDEELFRLPLEAGAGDGHFGLRLLQNHVRFTNFRTEHLN